MKHLVLYYDKYKTIPHTKTFETPEEMNSFIQRKLAAGIHCLEYNFVTKYSVSPTIVQSQL
jgi:hypothetical protein